MKVPVARRGSGIAQFAIGHLSIRSGFAWGALMLAAVFASAENSRADEGGVSFWIPGFFGSLAAAPQQPGWALATIDYYTNVSAGGAVALAREFELRNLPVGIQAQVNASLHANADIGFAIPTYVFATPVLGGQASVSLIEAMASRMRH